MKGLGNEHLKNGDKKQSRLTFKASIATAAGDIFPYRNKIIPYLLLLKKRQFFNCRLLQIKGGAS